MRGYSVLANIWYSFKRPISALRYIESPSFQDLLKAVVHVWTMNGLTTNLFMKSLSERGNKHMMSWAPDWMTSAAYYMLSVCPKKFIKIEGLYTALPFRFSTHHIAAFTH